MVNPQTVNKLKLLKELVDTHGGEKDRKDFDKIVDAFQTNETLTKVQAWKANNIYRKLKLYEV